MLDSLQSVGQSLGSDRFEKVVDGIDLESSHRKFVEGRHKDNRRYRSQFWQKGKSISIGHLHVQEDNVWAHVHIQGRGVCGTIGFSDNVNISVRCQKLSQEFPRRSFIVNNQRAPNLPHFPCP